MVDRIRFAHDHDIQAVAALISSGKVKRSNIASPLTQELRSVGQPGSRRHRRHLNSLLSESEYDTMNTDDGDEDDEEDKIYRPEWKHRFLAVGYQFYSQQSMLDSPDLAPNPTSCQVHGDPRLQRFLRYRAERIARRQERAAARSRTAGVPPMEPDLASHGPHGEVGEAVAAPDLAATRRSEYPGQELAGHLWGLIHRPSRKLLRKMFDFEFINSLEAIIHDFKSDHLYLSPEAAERSYASRNASSLVIVDGFSADHLVLVFQDSFLKGLGEAILAFHLLYYSQTDFGDPNQVVVKRQQGYFFHEASLESHIRQLQLLCV